MSAYARQPVARSNAGWTVAGNSASLAATANFPAILIGSGTVTHFGVGRNVSGVGQLLFSGAIAPPIVIAPGITPQLTTATQILQASGDGMANVAATDLLKLLFNNTAWANLGDATGVLGSATPGSLFLSLHTADPLESGSQTSNEVAYT